MACSSATGQERPKLSLHGVKHKYPDNPGIPWYHTHLDGSSHRPWHGLASGWSPQSPAPGAGHMSQTYGSAEGERQMAVHLWAVVFIPHLILILNTANNNSVGAKDKTSRWIQDWSSSFSSVLHSYSFSSSTHLPCPNRWQHLLGFFQFFSQGANAPSKTGE